MVKTATTRRAWNSAAGRDRPAAEMLNGPRTSGPGLATWVPVATPAPSSRSSVAIPAIVPVRQVLVVDDNSDFTATLAELVESLGHQVRTANDGASALATMSYFAPDIVLLDLGLPDLSGLDVARLIREQPGDREVVLVAVTGSGAAGDLAAVQRAGFDHYLVKPIGIESLTHLLGAAARQPPPPSRRRARGTGPLPGRRTLLAAADRAALGTDADAFANAVRHLLPTVDNDLSFELVAVIELARYDIELATLRWSHLRRRL
jgi:CheY-like chemotaxis protein